MMRLYDLTGQRFSRLIVIEPGSRNSAGDARWLCQCDCGTKKMVTTGNLRKGTTQSCGCLHRERIVTHGLTDHELYRVWLGMIKRCEDPSCPAYPNYGGRGIKVCERWRASFPDFLADVGERPADPPWWTSSKACHSLDRKDNDGDYELANIKWSDHHEQNSNTRRSRNDVDIRIVVKLYVDDGVSGEAIAKRFRCSTGIIYRMLRAEGVVRHREDAQQLRRQHEKEVVS